MTDAEMKMAAHRAEAERLVNSVGFVDAVQHIIALCLGDRHGSDVTTAVREIVRQEIAAARAAAGGR